MPPAPVLVVCAFAGALFFAGKPIVHGVKAAAHKTAHAVVHVVTLGKK
jgi:hypothetical protein